MMREASPRIVYEYSRLCFKRDQIERLDTSERFRVVKARREASDTRRQRS